ncbi:MAG: hypothetical protein IJF97_05700 [Eggerthellaceae bacterium]|nr:hypothetical protein [Eggerthellaceae bacterium]
MSNDFFNKHPMLGSVFDFNRDGKLGVGEAMSMGGVIGAYADEMMRVSKEAEREANESAWDEGDEDDRDPYGGRKHEKPARESIYDYEDVDATSRKAVMKAALDADYLGDIECLVEEALDNGVRFNPQDIIDLSYEIWDQDLLVRLISTSDPRFLQEDADDLSPRWGPVELEYHEEAFDEEYSEGNTYHVNLPEEDW